MDGATVSRCPGAEVSWAWTSARPRSAQRARRSARATWLLGAMRTRRTGAIEHRVARWTRQGQSAVEWRRRRVVGEECPRSAGFAGGVMGSHSQTDADGGVGRAGTARCNRRRHVQSCRRRTLLELDGERSRNARGCDCDSARCIAKPPLVAGRAFSPHRHDRRALDRRTSRSSAPHDALGRHAERPRCRGVKTERQQAEREQHRHVEAPGVPAGDAADWRGSADADTRARAGRSRPTVTPRVHTREASVIEDRAFESRRSPATHCTRGWLTRSARRLDLLTGSRVPTLTMAAAEFTRWAPHESHDS